MLFCKNFPCKVQNIPYILWFLVFVPKLDAQVHRSYRPSVAQKELQEFTETSIKNNAVKFDAPWIRYSGNLVHYFLGRVSDPRLLDGSQLHFALDQQYRVTLMRLYRPVEAWRAELAQIEVLIEETLKHQNFTLLVRRSIEDKINAIYQRKMDAVATARGGIAIRQPEVASLIEVYFRTSPSGGGVEHMGSGDYDLFLFLVNVKKRTNVKQPDWEGGLIGANSMLTGKYWIRVVWPDGKEFKRLISIDSPGATYVFSPSGVAKF